MFRESKSHSILLHIFHSNYPRSTRFVRQLTRTIDCTSWRNFCLGYTPSSSFACIYCDYYIVCVRRFMYSAAHRRHTGPYRLLLLMLCRVVVIIVPLDQVLDNCPALGLFQKFHFHNQLVYKLCAVCGAPVCWQLYALSLSTRYRI